MNRLAFVLVNETSIIYEGEINYFEILAEQQWISVVDLQGVQHAINLDHVMHIVDMSTLPKDEASPI